jgi:excinuclease UvrABC nuclease subunit
MSKKLIKSRLIAPYKSDERASNISFAKKKCGVYIVYENGKLAYIGYSGVDLEKTCLRHFQDWSKSIQARTVFRNRSACKVRIVLTNTPAQAYALEQALTFKYKPIDNLQVPDKIGAAGSRWVDEFEAAPIAPTGDFDLF